MTIQRPVRSLNDMLVRVEELNSLRAAAGGAAAVWVRSGYRSEAGEVFNMTCQQAAARMIEIEAELRAAMPKLKRWQPSSDHLAVIGNAFVLFSFEWAAARDAERGLRMAALTYAGADERIVVGGFDGERYRERQSKVNSNFEYYWEHMQHAAGVLAAHSMEVPAHRDWLRDQDVLSAPFAELFKFGGRDVQTPVEHWEIHDLDYAESKRKPNVPEKDEPAEGYRSVPAPNLAVLVRVLEEWSTNVERTGKLSPVPEEVHTAWLLAIDAKWAAAVIRDHPKQHLDSRTKEHRERARMTLMKTVLSFTLLPALSNFRECHPPYRDMIVPLLAGKPGRIHERTRRRALEKFGKIFTKMTGLEEVREGGPIGGKRRVSGDHVWAAFTQAVRDLKPLGFSQGRGRKGAAQK